MAAKTTMTDLLDRGSFHLDHHLKTQIVEGNPRKEASQSNLASDSKKERHNQVLTGTSPVSFPHLLCLSPKLLSLRFRTT